jgi:hypothetical protein
VRRNQTQPKEAFVVDSRNSRSTVPRPVNTPKLSINESTTFFGL